jgi:phosphatidylserine decarboxylase
VKRPFSSWREGAGFYVPCLVAGVVLTALLWPRPSAACGLVVLAAGVFAVYFFRDPARRVTAGEGDVVAPADGVVVSIDDVDESPHFTGPCRRVAIFLSLFSVHVNRAPVEGTVREVTYKPGRFKAAMKPETSDCNESNTVRLNCPQGPVTVRQIAGVVARRIICRCAPGDALAKGEKFGMIKFGSRTELYLPPGTEVCVRVKDKVRAGTTLVARFP